MVKIKKFFYLFFLIFKIIYLRIKLFFINLFPYFVISFFKKKCFFLSNSTLKKNTFFHYDLYFFTFKILNFFIFFYSYLNYFFLIFKNFLFYLYKIFKLFLFSTYFNKFAFENFWTWKLVSYLNFRLNWRIYGNRKLGIDIIEDYNYIFRYLIFLGKFQYYLDKIYFFLLKKLLTFNFLWLFSKYFYIFHSKNYGIGFYNLVFSTLTLKLTNLTNFTFLNIVLYFFIIKLPKYIAYFFDLEVFRPAPSKWWFIPKIVRSWFRLYIYKKLWNAFVFSILSWWWTYTKIFEYLFGLEPFRYYILLLNFFISPLMVFKNALFAAIWHHILVPLGWGIKYVAVGLAIGWADDPTAPYITKRRARTVRVLKEIWYWHKRPEEVRDMNINAITKSILKLENKLNFWYYHGVRKKFRTLRVREFRENQLFKITSRNDDDIRLVWKRLSRNNTYLEDKYWFFQKRIFDFGPNGRPRKILSYEISSNNDFFNYPIKLFLPSHTNDPRGYKNFFRLVNEKKFELPYNSVRWFKETFNNKSPLIDFLSDLSNKSDKFSYFFNFLNLKLKNFSFLKDKTFCYFDKKKFGYGSYFKDYDTKFTYLEYDYYTWTRLWFVDEWRRFERRRLWLDFIRKSRLKRGDYDLFRNFYKTIKITLTDFYHVFYNFIKFDFDYQVFLNYFKYYSHYHLPNRHIAAILEGLFGFEYFYSPYLGIILVILVFFFVPSIFFTFNYFRLFPKKFDFLGFILFNLVFLFLFFFNLFSFFLVYFLSFFYYIFYLFVIFQIPFLVFVSRLLQFLEILFQLLINTYTYFSWFLLLQFPRYIKFTYSVLFHSIFVRVTYLLRSFVFGCEYLFLGCVRLVFYVLDLFMEFVVFDFFYDFWLLKLFFLRIFNWFFVRIPYLPRIIIFWLLNFFKRPAIFSLAYLTLPFLYPFWELFGSSFLFLAHTVLFNDPYFFLGEAIHFYDLHSVANAYKCVPDHIFIILFYIWVGIPWSIFLLFYFDRKSFLQYGRFLLFFLLMFIYHYTDLITSLEVIIRDSLDSDVSNWIEQEELESAYRKINGDGNSTINTENEELKKLEKEYKKILDSSWGDKFPINEKFRETETDYFEDYFEELKKIIEEIKKSNKR